MPTRVIPSKDNDFLTRLANFHLKLPGYASVLGITATQLAADHALFAWIFGFLDPVDAAKQQFTTFKNLVRDGAAIATGTPPLNTAATLPILPTPPAAVPSASCRVAPRSSPTSARVPTSPRKSARICAS